MATVSVYLNFSRNTEEAFTFYKSVFGTEFEDGISRFADIPPQKDAPESMGFTVTKGNNVYINLEPDTRTETKRLFDALKDGGKVEMELQEMFWGDYFGSLTDKFGVRWMLNCSSKT